MTTVVGYLRPRPVAVPPPGLRERFARAAAAHSLTLTAVYTDEAPAAGSRGHRSGFTAALADVRERRADGVLLLNRDDLSWHPDIRDSLVFLVTEAGGQLFVAKPAGGHA